MRRKSAGSSPRKSAKATVRKGYVDTAFGQMHYQAAGTSGSWLFVVPQIPLSSQFYVTALSVLGQKFRAVVLDLPGCGASDPPARPPSIPQYARMAVAAIDAFTRDSFALVGLAGGAAIAVAVAAQQGRRVHHVILSGAPVIPPAEMREIRKQHDGEPHIEADGTHFLRAWKKREKAWAGRASPRQLHLAVVEAMRVYDHFNWVQRAIWRFNIAPHLKRIRSPALFLSGDDDRLAAFNAAASALVPGARHEILPGVNEPLFFNAEEILARRIHAFMRDKSA